MSFVVTLYKVSRLPGKIQRQRASNCGVERVDLAAHGQAQQHIAGIAHELAHAFAFVADHERHRAIQAHAVQGLGLGAALLGFFVFASAGLPGLAGFVGEFLVLQGTFVVNPWLAFAIAYVLVLAAAYLLWMQQRVLFGPVSDFLKA